MNSIIHNQYTFKTSWIKCWVKYLGPAYIWGSSLIPRMGSTTLSHLLLNSSAYRRVFLSFYPKGSLFQCSQLLSRLYEVFGAGVSWLTSSQEAAVHLKPLQSLAVFCFQFKLPAATHEWVWLACWENCTRMSWSLFLTQECQDIWWGLEPKVHQQVCDGMNHFRHA